MTNKTDSLYIEHILSAIKKIEEYSQGIVYEEFIQNSLIQDGILRQLEIIGEAAKHLSRKTTKKYSLIPWKEIVGMRNKLIHDYFGVDMDAVWETIIHDIPELKQNMLESNK